MKVGNVAIIGDSNYVLVDETTQDGVKYFLATMIDENDEPLFESEIVSESYENGVYYLTPVRDEKIFQYLSAVFVSNGYEDSDDEIDGE